MGRGQCPVAAMTPGCSPAGAPLSEEPLERSPMGRGQYPVAATTPGCSPTGAPPITMPPAVGQQTERRICPREGGPAAISTGEPPRTTRRQCPIPDCSYQVKALHSLRHHLNSSHRNELGLIPQAWMATHQQCRCPYEACKSVVLERAKGKKCAECGHQWTCSTPAPPEDPNTQGTGEAPFPTDRGLGEVPLPQDHGMEEGPFPLSLANVFFQPSNTLDSIPPAARPTMAALFITLADRACAANITEAWTTLFALFRSVLTKPARGGKAHWHATSATITEQVCLYAEVRYICLVRNAWAYTADHGQCDHVKQA